LRAAEPSQELLLPIGSAGIEPSKNLHLRASKQRLIKQRRYQVGRTDQECDTGAETAITDSTIPPTPIATTAEARFDRPREN